MIPDEASTRAQLPHSDVNGDSFVREAIKVLVNTPTDRFPRCRPVEDDLRHDNTVRAKWAAAAVAAHVDQTGGEDDTVETVVGDLLCNMRHLCQVYGMDFAALNEGARYRHAEEVHGDI